MINNLLITRLTEKDIEGAYKLFKITIPDAFKKSGSEDKKELIEKEIQHKKEILQEAVNNNNILFWVAKDKEKVIGTISYGPCCNDIKECTNNEITDLGELGSIFVLPEYQGQGVGSALINHLLAYLKKEGIKEFCLDSGYEQAQKTWLRKFGKPYAIVKDHWAPGVDNMVWRCSLTIENHKR